MIILEGTDGVGKSTVAKRLAAAGYVSVHAGPPTGTDWFDEYVAPVVDARDAGVNLVMDRWHVGEMVWPRYFGRDSLFTDETFALCCSILGMLEVSLVLVVRSRTDTEFELRKIRGETESQIKESMWAADDFIKYAEIASAYMPVEIHTSKTFMTSFAEIDPRPFGRWRA